MNRASRTPSVRAARGEVVAGRYRVDAVRADGSFAATDLAYGIEVDLFVLDPTRASDATAVTRFVRDGRIAMALRGAHVARALDCGALPDGTTYRATERVAGVDLASYLAAHVAVDTLVDLARQVCEGLAEAHDLGLAHGALDAGKVLVGVDERGLPLAKVVGFALPSAAPDAMSTREEIAADIRALGALLHGVLAPRSGVPRALHEIAARCSATRPGEGFEDVFEVSLALGAVRGSTSRAANDAVPRVDTTLRMMTPVTGTAPSTVRLARGQRPLVEMAVAGASAHGGVAGPVRPRRIGPYLIGAALARGGMASVFFGCTRDAAGELRPVALKRVRAELSDPHFATMLADEARIAARVRHPNVVETLDVVVDEDGEPIVAFEYVAGVSLSQLLRNVRGRGIAVPVPVAAALAVHVLQGLHAAHEAVDETGQRLDVVHRDVSPANILLEEHGRAKIADFGVAQARGRLQKTTETGAMKGKLGYLAPEQIHGRASRASDIYAVGVVLWEMLAGRALFVGSDGEILAAALLGNIAPPSTHGRPDAVVLDAVVTRALEHEPSGRFESARAMADAIVAVVELASAQEISAFVEVNAAEELARRRSAVAALLAQARELAPPAPVLPVRAPALPAPAPVPAPPAPVLAPPAPVPAPAPVLPAPAPAPRPRRTAWLTTSVLVALGLVAVALVFAWRTSRPTPPIVVDSAATTPSSPAPPAPSTAQPAPASGPTSAAPEPATAAAASSAAPPASPASAPRPRRPSVKPDPCTPPYHVNESGRRVWKRECFSR